MLLLLDLIYQYRWMNLSKLQILLLPEKAKLFQSLSEKFLQTACTFAHLHLLFKKNLPLFLADFEPSRQVVHYSKFHKDGFLFCRQFLFLFFAENHKQQTDLDSVHLASLFLLAFTMLCLFHSAYRLIPPAHHSECSFLLRSRTHNAKA